MDQQMILGQIMPFSGNPMRTPWNDVVHPERHGAVVIKDGIIIDVGPADVLRRLHPYVPVTDYGDALILPGFVDAHVHYPQTGIIASWGKRLVDWLNTYTFPEEMRLSHPEYAADIAARYLDLALAHGTTTVCSYCTSDPISVDAFFTAAAQRNMRVIGGKTCMDRNAPLGLCDTPQR
ncbi:MAG: amidohydrolase family protein, partial [Pseudomonadota bacterium]